MNPLLPAPRSPGPWVDTERCQICGQTYEAFRSGVSFQEGARRIRQAAEAAGDPRGGWKSPGPVLWAMRVIKLERWYLEHFPCGNLHRQKADLRRARTQLQRWRTRNPGWQDPEQRFTSDPPYTWEPEGDIPF